MKYNNFVKYAIESIKEGVQRVISEYPQVLMHLYFCFIVLLIVLLIIAIRFLVRSVIKNRVNHLSSKLLELRFANDTYAFNQLRSVYKYTHYFPNKVSFDNCAIDLMMDKYVEENMFEFREIIDKANQNNSLYSKYQNSLDFLLTSENEDNAFYKNRLFAGTYRKFEDSLFEQEIKHPVILPVFLMKIVYTSPKGRNEYSREKKYSLREIEQYYEDAEQRIQSKQTAKHQRLMMTPSLRMEVLKRDGFRCVLCGRDSKHDGVKLEVDHIVPVSKGGKTELSNLQTLCMDCNRGKSNKIIETDN